MERSGVALAIALLIAATDVGAQPQQPVPADEARTLFNEAVAQMQDGSLLISDDYNGAVWRLSYNVNQASNN